MSTRDYSDPAYEAARRAVRDRDGSKCSFPGCNSRKRLQAHHVRRWADAPSLRNETSNMVLLCKKHHTLVTGNEDAYAGLFLLTNSPLIVEMIRARYEDRGEDV